MKKILALVLVISFAFVLVGCAKGEKFKKDIYKLTNLKYNEIIKYLKIVYNVIKGGNYYGKN